MFHERFGVSPSTEQQKVNARGTCEQHQSFRHTINPCDKARDFIEFEEGISRTLSFDFPARCRRTKVLNLLRGERLKPEAEVAHPLAECPKPSQVRGNPTRQA